MSALRDVCQINHRPAYAEGFRDVQFCGGCDQVWPCDVERVNDGKDLWGAIGELRRTRRELVGQLANVVKDSVTAVSWSGCPNS